MFGDNWFRDRYVDEVAVQQRRLHLASVRGRSRLQQRVERLEEELAWTRLVASALAALCVEKGVTTPEELKERIGRLDAAEGIEHGNPAPAPPPTAPGASDARRAARRRKFPRRD